MVCVSAARDHDLGLRNDGGDGCDVHRADAFAIYAVDPFVRPHVISIPSKMSSPSARSPFSKCRYSSMLAACFRGAEALALVHAAAAPCDLRVAQAQQRVVATYVHAEPILVGLRDTRRGPCATSASVEEEPARLPHFKSLLSVAPEKPWGHRPGRRLRARGWRGRMVPMPPAGHRSGSG
jgi:hypothetical protein